MDCLYVFYGFMDCLCCWKARPFARLCLKPKVLSGESVAGNRFWKFQSVLICDLPDRVLPSFQWTWTSKVGRFPTSDQLCPEVVTKAGRPQLLCERCPASWDFWWCQWRDFDQQQAERSSRGVHSRVRLRMFRFGPDLQVKTGCMPALCTQFVGFLQLDCGTKQIQ